MNAKRTIAALAVFVELSMGLAATFGQPAKTPKASKATAAPVFKYDGTWPKLPLPNKWAFEGVTGLTVDKDDVIWVLGSFGFSGHAGGGFHWLHMIATDSKGNVYTGEVDTGKRVQRFLLQK